MEETPRTAREVMFSLESTGDRSFFLVRESRRSCQEVRENVARRRA